eukprot:GHVP01046547.1.p1 GENE.GHVP01046547.1~~GHVP01046547.1.p1  ORF type:complete len:135 (-),score=2.56 GHVP01046547.1:819-1223(-)
MQAKCTPTNCWVRSLWADSGAESRQVLLTKIRVFTDQLPKPLRDVAMDNLKHKTPRFSKYRRQDLHQFTTPTQLQQPDDCLPPVPHEPLTARKRRLVIRPKEESAVTQDHTGSLYLAHHPKERGINSLFWDFGF